MGVASARYTDLKTMRTDGIAQGAYVDLPTFRNDTLGSFSMWLRQYSPLAVTGVRSILSLTGNTPIATGDPFWSFEQRNNPVGTGGVAVFCTYMLKPTAPNIQGSYPSTYVIPASTRLHVVHQSAGPGNFPQYYINGVLYTGVLWFDTTGANKGAWMGEAAAYGATRFNVAYRNRGGTPDTWNDMQIDELNYLNRVRTPAEITAEYNAGTTRGLRGLGYGSDLKSWWRMGDRDVIGTTIYDRIGTNHLTTVGSPTYVTP